MRQLRTILVLLLIALLAGCGGESGQKTGDLSGKVLVSKERTAIFPKEKALLLISSVCYQRRSPVDGITAFWTPTEEDLAGVESPLESYLERNASTYHRSALLPVRDWAGYYRQVAGIVIGDRKLLFLNYHYAGSAEMQALRARMQNTPDEWKTIPLLRGPDWGYRFFRVIWDPGKKTFVWYEEDGDA